MSLIRTDEIMINYYPESKSFRGIDKRRIDHYWWFNCLEHQFLVGRKNNVILVRVDYTSRGRVFSDLRADVCLQLSTEK